MRWWAVSVSAERISNSSITCEVGLIFVWADNEYAAKDAAIEKVLEKLTRGFRVTLVFAKVCPEGAP